MNRTTIWAIAALVAITPATGAGAAPMDRIVAIVNGRVITRSELDEAIAKRRANLFEVGDGGPVAAAAGEVEKQALNDLIDRRIQLQLAEKRGLSVDPDELERAEKDIRSRNGIPSEEALAALLKQQGLSLKQYREDLRQQILTIKLANRDVKSGIILSTEEMRAFYRDHPDRFALPDEVHLTQVLFPAARPAEFAAARTAATTIAARARAGAALEELARQGASPMPSDLGFVKKGHMLSYVEAAVTGLKPGQISEPVQTPAGVQLFRLESLRTGQVRPYDEVESEIREALYQERSRALFGAWLRDLRDKAQVEVKP